MSCSNSSATWSPVPPPTLCFIALSPQTVPPHQVEPVSESRLGLVAVLPTGVEWSIPGPPSVLVYSDTSGSFSCGAVVPNGAWFNAQWPPSWSVNRPLNLKKRDTVCLSIFIITTYEYRCMQLIISLLSTNILVLINIHHYCQWILLCTCMLNAYAIDCVHCLAFRWTWGISTVACPSPFLDFCLFVVRNCRNQWSCCETVRSALKS